jgi:hypothetical protein
MQEPVARPAASPPPARLPYATPRLTRYGAIGELTAMLSAGASDGVAGSILLCSTLPC